MNQYFNLNKIFFLKNTKNTIDLCWSKMNVNQY